MSLHGAIRGTVAVDTVVSLVEADLIKLKASLNMLGLISRYPITSREVFLFKDEYIANRKLIAWNFYNPKNALELVDVLLDVDISALKIENMSTVQGPLPVVSGMLLLI